MKLARKCKVSTYHLQHHYFVGEVDLPKGTPVSDVGPAQNQENNDGFVRFQTNGVWCEAKDEPGLITD